MLFGGKKILGLDLGSSSLKMAELEVSRNSATLLSFGFAPTPANSIVGGEINDIAQLATAVSILHNELGTRRKNTVTGMWGTSVIVKKITVPMMEKSLLAEQVRWEAEQYVPYDINEVSLDFQVLPHKKDSDALDVVIVAARTELVQRYVSTVQTAGIECSVLDVSGFALANCFEFNYGKVPGQVALFNIGASVTNFVIVEDGLPVFTRDIPVGGMMYNNDIQSEMNVSAEEAESLKVSASMSQPVPAEVDRVLKASTEQIAKEIYSTLEFHNTTSGRDPISQIYVAGGTSVYKPLVDALSEKTGITIAELNPFLKIKYSRRKFTPDFMEQIKPFCAIVVGLALRRGAQ